MKRTRKAKLITRTFDITTAEVMALNVKTRTVETVTYEIMGTFDTESRLLAEIKSRYETDEFKPSAIVSVTVKEVLYGMPEEDFIAAAKVLPPRSGAETATDED